MDNLFNNSWLSGFIDADGNFYIRISKEKEDMKKSRRIEIRFRLEQRKEVNKKSYIYILKQISTEFDLSLTETTHNKRLYYCINGTSLNKLKKLIDYLEKYSLFTSKY
jgi:hypothetical protein